MVDCYKVVYGDDVVEIMLYGSYARGNVVEDSDIDIVALVHGSREDLQAKLKMVWDVSAEIGLENDVIVSPMVIPYDEFEKYKQSLPYYRNIAEEGREIGFISDCLFILAQTSRYTKYKYSRPNNI